MSGLRPGLVSWEDLAQADLSGGSLSAVVYGNLIHESIDSVEFSDASKRRIRFLSNGKEVQVLPVQPVTGPLYDSAKPDQLFFAIGMAGEGFIALAKPVEEFVVAATGDKENTEEV